MRHYYARDSGMLNSIGDRRRRFVHRPVIVLLKLAPFALLPFVSTGNALLTQHGLRQRVTNHLDRDSCFTVRKSAAFVKVCQRIVFSSLPYLMPGKWYHTNKNMPASIIVQSSSHDEISMAFSILPHYPDVDR